MEAGPLVAVLPAGVPPAVPAGVEARAAVDRLPSFHRRAGIRVAQTRRYPCRVKKVVAAAVAKGRIPARRAARAEARPQMVARASAPTTPTRPKTTTNSISKVAWIRRLAACQADFRVDSRAAFQADCRVASRVVRQANLEQVRVRVVQRACRACQVCRGCPGLRATAAAVLRAAPAAVPGAARLAVQRVMQTAAPAGRAARRATQRVVQVARPVVRVQALRRVAAEAAAASRLGVGSTRLSAPSTPRFARPRPI